MIGSANKHLDFNAFLLNLAPIVIIMQLQQQYFMYRKQLIADPVQVKKLMSLDENNTLKIPY